MAEYDPNLLQCYVLLSTDELKAIGALFDAHDREEIQKAVKTMIQVYIKEHTREDRIQMDSEMAWDKLKDLMANR
ncbi:MAG: hypothetical protein IKR47_00710 [Lachnospiraceae bacterium]|nr:hypothetical protein [Parasporobacterium sp.]MBR4168230.1 hypothetical protein [Lachnospiraceae bacterium]MCR4684266.1 hypothetical protein [Lachnospiraceae bacterium]MCR4684724.1 hypothetical protein [Lachnospiraceae bacterium]